MNTNEPIYVAFCITDGIYNIYNRINREGKSINTYASFERWSEMRSMRETGMSYREIGAYFGISRQRVQQILERTPGHYRYSKVLESYPELQKYMYEHGMNLNDFANSAGIDRIRFKQCLNHEKKFSDQDIQKIKSVFDFGV